jgi:hypothetical protein
LPLFLSVLQGVAKSNQKDAGLKAELIFERLVEFQEEENPAVGPDERSFKVLLSYYDRSREPDAPYRAEYWLNRMVHLFKDGQSSLAPPAFSIASVIRKYGHARHPDAGRNADRLLKLLSHLRNDWNASSLAVDTYVINSVIFAWGKSGDKNAGMRAEGYLDEMESFYENGICELQPNTQTYVLVLEAWFRSSSPFKFRRALKVLRRMEDQQRAGNGQVVVDDEARSLVIGACGIISGDANLEAEAFETALCMFGEIVDCSISGPSPMSFSRFIQVCGLLKVAANTKEAQIERAFRLCCDMNLVDNIVLQRLKGAASKQTYRRLLTYGREKIADLPLDWGR